MMYAQWLKLVTCFALEHVPAAGSLSAYILGTHRYTVHRDNDDIQSGRCRRIAKHSLAGIIFGHQAFTYMRFLPRIRAPDFRIPFSP
jgi:hypothetical protein